MKKLATILIVGTLLASCSNNAPDVPGDSDSEEIASISFSRSESATNDALNRFSLNFFADAANANDESEGNYMYSPLSAAIAMGLIANSTTDDIATTIANLIGYTSIDDFNSTCNKLMTYLPHKSNGTSLVMGNSVWVPANLTVSTNYADHIKDLLNADVFSYSSPTNLATGIKNWYHDSINENFPTMIFPQAPDYIVLMNALYFDGEWSKKFDPGKTKYETFHGTNGDEEVPMMYGGQSACYYEMDDCIAVSIPFKNKKTDMFFIMPNEEVSIDDLAKGFNYSKFEEMLSHKTNLNIALKIPRFETSCYKSITPVLESKGIEISDLRFDKAGIDMTQTVSLDNSTYLSIKEDGAKVATATSTATLTSTEYIPVTFDSPFLFMIRNNETGSIIVIGCIKYINEPI